MFINLVDKHKNNLVEAILRSQFAIQNIQKTPNHRMVIGDITSWALRQYFTNRIPHDIMSCVENESLYHDLEVKTPKGVERISIKTFGSKVFRDGGVKGISVKNVHTAERLSEEKTLQIFTSNPGFDYLLVIQRGGQNKNSGDYIPISFGIISTTSLFNNPGVSFRFTGDQIKADIKPIAWDYFHKGTTRIKVTNVNTHAPTRELNAQIAYREYIEKLFKIGEITYDME